MEADHDELKSQRDGFRQTAVQLRRERDEAQAKCKEAEVKLGESQANSSRLEEQLETARRQHTKIIHSLRADHGEELKRLREEHDRELVAAREKAVEDFKASSSFEEAMWAYGRALYRMARYHCYQ